MVRPCFLRRLLLLRLPGGNESLERIDILGGIIARSVRARAGARWYSQWFPLIGSSLDSLIDVWGSFVAALILGDEDSPHSSWGAGKLLIGVICSSTWSASPRSRWSIEACCEDPFSINFIGGCCSQDVFPILRMQFASHASQVSDNEAILSMSTAAVCSDELPSSTEIKAFDSECDPEIADIDDEHCNLVNQEPPQCRICLDSEGEDLIAPCYCRGTQKYVHRSCLDNWRSTKEGFAFAHCTECKAMFLLRANVPADRWWQRLKFQLLVARDHVLIFITVQLVVVFLGVLVYRFYGEELREMFGYEKHPYGFYTMAILGIILVGFLYGFFIAVICGQRINERHYHVLATQERTKEYVVESRDENKCLPELDPSHVTELRMMGLY